MADAEDEQQEAQLVRRIHRAVGGPSKLSTYDDPALVRHVVLLALAEEYPDDTERITRGDLTAFERRIVRTVTNRGAAVRSRMRQRRELARLREECRKKDEKIEQLEITIASLQGQGAIGIPHSPPNNNNHDHHPSASASASASYATLHNSPLQDQHHHQNIAAVSAPMYQHPSPQFIASSSTQQQHHHQFLPGPVQIPVSVPGPSADPAIPMEYKYNPPPSSSAVRTTIIQPSVILPPSQGSPSTRITTPYETTASPISSGRIQKKQTHASASSSSNEASAVEQDNFGNFIDHLLEKP